MVLFLYKCLTRTVLLNNNNFVQLGLNESDSLKSSSILIYQVRTKYLYMNRQLDAMVDSKSKSLKVIKHKCTKCSEEIQMESIKLKREITNFWSNSIIK